MFVCIFGLKLFLCIARLFVRLGNGQEIVKAYNPGMPLNVYHAKNLETKRTKHRIKEYPGQRA